MAAKLKSSDWSDFSERFVRIQSLPRGTELRLYRLRDDRRVRSDFSVKRKAINRTNVPQLDDSVRVMKLLEEARTLLSTDIDARGLEMRLYAPDGTHIGNSKSLGKVRQMEPAVTDKNEPFEIFSELLDDVGLGDVSVREAGKLYVKLCEVVGNDLFDKQLLRLAQGG